MKYSVISSVKFTRAYFFFVLNKPVVFAPEFFYDGKLQNFTETYSTCKLNKRKNYYYCYYCYYLVYPKSLRTLLFVFEIA